MIDSDKLILHISHVVNGNNKLIEIKKHIWDSMSITEAEVHTFCYMGKYEWCNWGYLSYDVGVNEKSKSG